MKNVAIITGASSGIGREFVRQLDRKLPAETEIWLVARRRDVLVKLRNHIKHQSRVLSLDLCKQADLEKLKTALEWERPNVSLLVNCAGFGLMGSFANLPGREQASMIRLNCESLMQVTYLALPYMSSGTQVINMASGAAFLPQADFAVYAASKAFVLSFSRALKHELKCKGVSVTAVCPGPVNTDFFKTAEKYEKCPMAIKKLTMISPRRCVKQALIAAGKKKAVCVPGIPMKLLQLLGKILPQEVILTVEEWLK